MENHDSLIAFALSLPDYQLDLIPTKRGKRWTVTIDFSNDGYPDSKIFTFETEAKAVAAIDATILLT